MTQDGEPSTATAQAEMLYREGDRLHDEGDRSAAVARLQAALAIDPAHWLARYTLAVVFQDLGRHADAEAIYEALLAEGGSHAKLAKAWLNLGVACHHLGRGERAEAAYREALAIDPGNALAAKNLADLLCDQGDDAGAHAALAPFLDSQNPGALDLCDALILPAVPASDEAIDLARARALAGLEALRANPPTIADPLREIGRLPAFQIGHGLDDRPFLVAQAGAFRAACPALAFVAPHVRRYRGPQWKLKVGFVSAFFGEHSVGRAMHGVIERLPRSRFDVSVFFLSGRGDDRLAKAIAAGADHAVDVPYDVFAAQQAIAERELDALVFADIGLEMLSYCLALGRLAPLQATSWGQPETSGIDTVDDYLSVASWEGSDAPESRYTERLVYFTDIATPSWLDRPLFPQGGAGLPGEGVRIYCPHGAQKLHPDFDDLLPEILAAAPQARLFLHQPGVEGWARRLQARVDKAFAARADGAKLRERLHWLEPMDRARYLACLRSADLLLDTPYFGGGPVLIDAIAAGVPYVTFGGDALRARSGAGLLEFMGIPGFIAQSSRDYVAMVAQLANDAGSRLSYRAAISERAGAVFEDARVIARWADYLEHRVVDIAKNPGRLPGV
jgi:predicted O-linked N-acetylglucosamine transferase (SPINDLY family)